VIIGAYTSLRQISSTCASAYGERVAGASNGAVASMTPHEYAMEVPDQPEEIVAQGVMRPHIGFRCSAAGWPRARYWIRAQNFQRQALHDFLHLVATRMRMNSTIRSPLTSTNLAYILTQSQ